ncbi:MAG: hypothetical protein LBE04_03955 [Prevotellaceae bacterium]|jgi:hypothetical protein|nr:hypothetical protein [Prevotellaceae bacterium]
MKKYLIDLAQHANLSRGAMETGDHSKNGANLQNLSSAKAMESRDHFKNGVNLQNLSSRGSNLM